MRRRASVVVLALGLIACGESGPTIIAVDTPVDVADSASPSIVGSDTEATGSDAPAAEDLPPSPPDVPVADLPDVSEPDTAPIEDPGAPVPDTPPPLPDDGPPLDLPAGGDDDAGGDVAPPTCDCGPDQLCVDGTCVTTCLTCDCAPGPNSCPNAPGGGQVPGATTPDAYATLQQLTGTSAHWGACAAGDELACHLFTREAARFLFEKDPSWGLLTKVPGQNQCNATACGNDVTCGYAGDAIIYRATNQVVDMVAGVGLPGASVAWQLVPKLDYNNWAPPPCDVVQPKDALLSGEALASGQKRVSADGRFQLEYQADGDLVLTHVGVGVLWQSGTKSAPGNAQMQLDGNLVVYDASGAPLWATGTGGHPGAWLVLQTDGNAILHGTDGTPLWATNTCCY